MPTIGDRIRQARVAAGFSQSELAHRAAPLSAMAISKYERGLDTPRPSVILRLAQALNVDPQYFYQPVRVELQDVQYRKRLRHSACERIEERVREELEPYLEVESTFPDGWIRPPLLDQDDGYPVASAEEAEGAAEELRRRWQLGTAAIRNVPESLEDCGIKVVPLEGPAGFEGLSCWANANIPVLVANSRKPWDQQRLDVAHELGELFLRAASGGDRARAIQRFARAFLVPRDAVQRALGSRRTMLHIGELRLLREAYGLSVVGWLRRAYETGVIDAAKHKRLLQRWSAQGVLDDVGTTPREPDRSFRFRLLVYQAESEGFITPIRRAELLREVSEPSRSCPSEAEMRAAAERLCGDRTTLEAK